MAFNTVATAILLIVHLAFLVRARNSPGYICFLLMSLFTIIAVDPPLLFTLAVLTAIGHLLFQTNVTTSNETDRRNHTESSPAIDMPPNESALMPAEGREAHTQNQARPQSDNDSLVNETRSMSSDQTEPSEPTTSPRLGSSYELVPPSTDKCFAHPTAGESDDNLADLEAYRDADESDDDLPNLEEDTSDHSDPSPTDDEFLAFYGRRHDDDQRPSPSMSNAATVGDNSSEASVETLLPRNGESLSPSGSASPDDSTTPYTRAAQTNDELAHAIMNQLRSLSGSDTINVGHSDNATPSSAGDSLYGSDMIAGTILSPPGAAGTPPNSAENISTPGTFERAISPIPEADEEDEEEGNEKKPEANAAIYELSSSPQAKSGEGADSTSPPNGLDEEVNTNPSSSSSNENNHPVELPASPVSPSPGHWLSSKPLEHLSSVSSFSLETPTRRASNPLHVPEHAVLGSSLARARSRENMVAPLHFSASGTPSSASRQDGLRESDYLPERVTLQESTIGTPMRTPLPESTNNTPLRVPLPESENNTPTKVSLPDSTAGTPISGLTSYNTSQTPTPVSIPLPASTTTIPSQVPLPPSTTSTPTNAGSPAATPSHRRISPLTTKLTTLFSRQNAQRRRGTPSALAREHSTMNLDGTGVSNLDLDDVGRPGLDNGTRHPSRSTSHGPDLSGTSTPNLHFNEIGRPGIDNGDRTFNLHIDENSRSGIDNGTRLPSRSTSLGSWQEPPLPPLPAEATEAEREAIAGLLLERQRSGDAGNGNGSQLERQVSGGSQLSRQASGGSAGELKRELSSQFAAMGVALPASPYTPGLSPRGAAKTSPRVASSPGVSASSPAPASPRPASLASRSPLTPSSPQRNFSGLSSKFAKIASSSDVNTSEDTHLANNTPTSPTPSTPSPTPSLSAYPTSPPSRTPTPHPDADSDNEIEHETTSSSPSSPHILTQLRGRDDSDDDEDGEDGDAYDLSYRGSVHEARLSRRVAPAEASRMTRYHGRGSEVVGDDEESDGAGEEVEAEHEG